MIQKKIEFVEVGPRDGFQNVKAFIPTALKMQIIDGLVKSGIKNIQLTSFVNPKAVPQMSDARDIVALCLEKYKDVNFFALVPNLHGAKVAIDSGLTEISYVISVSETHNLKNVKRTHEESFSELVELLKLYPEIKVNLDVATTFGCFYEGEIPISKVLTFIKKAYDIGIRSFNLCDTVGYAYPSLIKEIISKLLDLYPNCEFQVHIHDTKNMGIVNSYVAIECGIRKVQTSIGGLGGCPFAPGASGNTSTEDFVYMLNKMDYRTGVDFEILLQTAKLLHENVVGNYSGHHIMIENETISCS